MIDRDRNAMPEDAFGDESAAYTRLPMDSGAVASRSELPGGVAGGDSAVDEMPSRTVTDPETPAPMALLSAQEQERSRLAEELHDGPAQALANALFQIQIVDRALRDDPPSARSELASLREMLERELDTLRGYINQLRPSLNEAAGLDDALRDAAAAFTQRTGVPVDIFLGGSDASLHQAAQTVVLRVAQEALRNVAKHSAANRVWLKTAEAPAADGGREWMLEVGDDGRGFDYAKALASPDKRHFGLRFMRERAELLGSRLSIHTEPTTGTVVRLTITTAATAATAEG